METSIGTLVILLGSFTTIILLSLWATWTPWPFEEKVEKFIYSHADFMGDMLSDVPLEVIMDRCRAAGGVPRRPKEKETQIFTFTIDTAVQLESRDYLTGVGGVSGVGGLGGLGGLGVPFGNSCNISGVGGAGGIGMNGFDFMTTHYGNTCCLPVKVKFNS